MFLERFYVSSVSNDPLVQCVCVCVCFFCLFLDEAAHIPCNAVLLHLPVRQQNGVSHVRSHFPVCSAGEPGPGADRWLHQPEAGGCGGCGGGGSGGRGAADHVCGAPATAAAAGGAGTAQRRPVLAARVPGGRRGRRNHRPVW